MSGDHESMNRTGNQTEKTRGTGCKTDSEEEEQSSFDKWGKYVLTVFICLAVGSAVGCGVTYFVTKNKKYVVHVYCIRRV